MTDRELLQRYTTQTGDQAAAAMRDLVSRHIALVHATALREVRDPHLADDITQAVFLLLLRRARTLNPGVVLGGWLFQTTLYTSAEARRKNTRRIHHERETPAMETRSDHDPETTAHSAEVRAMLNFALSLLAGADRDAIVLRYLQGQSTAEVAIAMGTTENTARQRLVRALEHLRQQLRKKGIFIAAVALTASLETAQSHAAPASLLASVHAIVQGAAPAASIQTLVTGVLHMALRVKQIAVAACIIVAACGVGTVAVQLSHEKPKEPPTQPANPTVAATTPPEITTAHGEGQITPGTTSPTADPNTPVAQTVTASHKMRYASAVDAARLINALYAPQIGAVDAGGRAAITDGNPRIHADADAQTNTIQFIGPPDQVQQAMDFAAKIDQQNVTLHTPQGPAGKN